MNSKTEKRQLKDLVAIVAESDWFMSNLHAVKALNLESWCIGAGAVRNLVWDSLHGFQKPSKLSDVDVAFFDSEDLSKAQDERLESRLLELLPEVPWEVTNQAGVHRWFEACFGHSVKPLKSLEEAVASWPEFATSVGVYLTEAGRIEIIAPHGLNDLFAMLIRRNPTRVSVETYRQRVKQKGYDRRWPKATIVPC